MNTILAVNVWAHRLLWIPRIFLVSVVAWLGFLSAERAPPYAVMNWSEASGRAGEVMQIEMSVRRDTSRGCSVTFWRQVVDSQGRPFPLSSQSASAESVADIEARTPGKLLLSLRIPQGAAPGPALLVTDREYVCNVTHQLWPIQYRTAVPFVILP